MGSHLEHHDKSVETPKRAMHSSDHAAAEADSELKPQAQSERVDRKEPDRVSFNQSDLYAGETYKIARGDNLTHIAEKRLGDNASDRDVQNYINAIARHNHLKDKNLIYAGDTLELPEIQLTEGRHTLTSPKEPLSTASTSEAITGGHLPNSGQTAFNDTSNKVPTEGATESTIPAADNNKQSSTDNANEPAATGQKMSGDRPPVSADNLVKRENNHEIAETATSGKVDLQMEHDTLEKLAHSKMSPEDFLNFATNMNRLERRIGDMEDALKKQGLPPEEASRKAHEQIGNTYKQIGTLLKAKDNPSVPIDESGRNRLAREILSNAADPTDIRQGSHKTCNVTTIEIRHYTREPATAARIVVDMATKGEYISGDGTKIKLDQESLKPDQNAQMKNSASNRNYASQLLQVTAVNLHYSKIDPYLHYEQHKIDPTLTPPDTGERIVDYSSNPPEELTVSWFNKTFLNQDDSMYHTPGLYSEDIVRINEAITGKPETGWLLDARDGQGDVVVKPTSAQDLEEKLLEAKKTGKLPLTVVVHTGNEPFLTDSGDGTAGDAGCWHVVNVIDIEAGSPASISVDNQWPKEKDHLDNDRLSSKELFGAMKLPGDAETVMEMQEEISQNRKSGKIDDFRELELLSLLKLMGKISEDQYNRAFLNHLEESQNRWHEIMSHGTNDLAVLKNMEKAEARQTEILSTLPADLLVTAIEIESETGYHSYDQIDNHLGFSIAKTRRDYEAESAKEDPMPEENRRAYRRAIHMMVEMIDDMPPERRENIRKIARDYGEEDDKARQAKPRVPVAVS